MTSDPWQTELLDLDRYLDRVGATAGPPSAERLAELHEAHVRTFTFDNIDVVLAQHPGVGLGAIQEKFLDRGRGGYCFEHASLFSAVLQRLGYTVSRQLGRVGDPAAVAQQARTHMVVIADIDGQRWLCDPGFGMSLLRPIRLEEGTEDDQVPGWAHRLRVTSTGGWVLERRRENVWEVAHTTDELAVTPADLRMAHHFTSTYPESHFRRLLMIAKHLPGRHVTITQGTVTIRTPGEATEHRPLRPGEFEEWLDTLEVSLAATERTRLREWVQAHPLPDTASEPDEPRQDGDGSSASRSSSAVRAASSAPR